MMEKEVRRPESQCRISPRSLAQLRRFNSSMCDFLFSRKHKMIAFFLNALPEVTWWHLIWSAWKYFRSAWGPGNTGTIVIGNHMEAHWNIRTLAGHWRVFSAYWSPGCSSALWKDKQFSVTPLSSFSCRSVCHTQETCSKASCLPVPG